MSLTDTRVLFSLTFPYTTRIGESHLIGFHSCKSTTALYKNMLQFTKVKENLDEHYFVRLFVHHIHISNVYFIYTHHQCRFHEKKNTL